MFSPSFPSDSFPLDHRRQSVPWTLRSPLRVESAAPPPTSRVSASHRHLCASSPHGLCRVRVLPAPRWAWAHTGPSQLGFYVHFSSWDLGNVWQLRHGQCRFRDVVWLGGKKSLETSGFTPAVTELLSVWQSQGAFVCFLLQSVRCISA